MPAGTLVLPEKLDPRNLDSYVTASPISDAVFARINGAADQCQCLDLLRSDVQRFCRLRRS